MGSPDRPVVGVTCENHEHARTYADAVERSGGDPWIILPDHDPSPEDTLERIGGLLLCGGEDIHPRWYGPEWYGPGWYGEKPEETAGLAINEARDAVEMPLLRAALDADVPVLCICRGMQALNVVTGGKLVEAIAGHGSTEQDGEKVSSYHRIFISPGSKLAAVVGSGGFVRVNSRHDHGVREAQKSPLLMASAYSLEDGVIEALESPHHRWVIGVQFHPERRREVPPHFDRLFQSLIERAKEYTNTRK